MKIFFENTYYQVKRRSSSIKLQNENIQTVELNNTFGDINYLIVCYDALSNKPKRAISFSSDLKEEDFSIMLHNEHVILFIGNQISILDRNNKIICEFTIYSTLAGVHSDSTNILFVEEDRVRVFSLSRREIVLDKSVDLITDYSLNQNELYIITDSEEEKIIVW